MFDGPDALLELQRHAEAQALSDQHRTMEEIAKHAPDSPGEDEKNFPEHQEVVASV